MSTNNRPRNRRAYTPNMRTPTVEKDERRVPLAIILLLLLPPIGLYYLWRMGVFRTRGRFFMTAIAMVEMTLIMVLLLPAKSTPTQQPIPSVPVAATVVPSGEIINALSNIDQLLADQQAESADYADITPEPTDQAAYRAEQEAILNTTVYSVFGSSAKYYHSVEICGTQTNRRALTVREAMTEGMGACPNCDPPVYIG